MITLANARKLGFIEGVTVERKLEPWEQVNLTGDIVMWLLREKGILVDVYDKFYDKFVK